MSAILSAYQGTKNELIPILQRVQGTYGYLPEAEMSEVARITKLPESRVYGVATFYAQFRLTPMGRNRVMVCRGTACHVRGAQQVLSELSRQLGIAEGETTSDQEYTLETVACVGCCALAPCVTINNQVHGRLTLKTVSKLMPG